MLFIASTGTEGVAAKKPLKEQVKAIGKQLVSPCLISCFIAMFLALFGVTDEAAGIADSITITARIYGSWIKIPPMK